MAAFTVSSSAIKAAVGCVSLSKTTAASTGAVSKSGSISLPGFCGGCQGLQALCDKSRVRTNSRCNFSIRAATTLTKFKTLKPLGDRVLVKVKSAEEKSVGGILLPTSVQSKPSSGEVVAIGEGRVMGDKKVAVDVEAGANVVYSKYAGTEVEFGGQEHVLVKEDDIVGLMVSDDVKDMKPLGERVLIKVAEVEEKSAGGVLLTESSKEKPSVGTVIAVGPGPLAEDGKRRALDVVPGNSVMYSKYAGQDYKSADGSQYVIVRASDIMAILS